jgi:hypothetical protein
MFPLTSCTRKPILYSTFSFGGNDLLGYHESFLDEDDELFNHRVKLQNDYIKAMKDKDLIMMKKIEDDYELYQENVIDKINDKRDTDKVISLIRKKCNNTRQRERIVETLGGKDFCESIPIITVKYFDDYLNFDINELPEESNIAQYEDDSGRKGLLLKFKNKTTDEFEIAWFFQRYRETSSSGDLWMANGAVSLEGVDAIIKFLNQLKPIPHKTYELAL